MKRGTRVMKYNTLDGVTDNQPSGYRTVEESITLLRLAGFKPTAGDYASSAWSGEFVRTCGRDRQTAYVYNDGSYYIHKISRGEQK